MGRLDWAPNRDGLKWFLHQVWPLLQKNRDVHLTIIGAGESSWLRPYVGSEDIDILGYVEDLSSFYRDCHLTLIPLFEGSGTRVKALESAMNGRSFISTPLGSEGLHFEPQHQFIEAQGATAWIAHLSEVRIEALSAMGAAIQTHFSKVYCARAVGQRAADYLFTNQ